VPKLNFHLFDEMCHCFYGIANETKIKHKVLEITNRYVDADAKFADLFPGWQTANQLS